MRLALIRYFILFVFLFLLMPHLVFAKTAKEPQKQENEAQQTAPGNTPGESLKPFSFLGVDKNSAIDPTRKNDFEDYRIKQKRYCIGCWCNHAFPLRLDESHKELEKYSEEFKLLRKAIAPCQKELINTIPQIRAIPLTPKFSDTSYEKLTFYFSELIDKPLLFKIFIKDAKKSLDPLKQEFGTPLEVKKTWYIWKSGNDVMLYDLFAAKFKKSPTGILYVYFMDNVKQHFAALKHVKL